MNNPKTLTTLSALTLASALALTACSGPTEEGGAAGSSSPAATSASDGASGGASGSASEGASGSASDSASEAASSSASASATEPAEEVSAEHNESDTTFAQMMLPHHEQAVEMSEILQEKEDVPAEVSEFSQGVIDAQQPEIDQLKAMLEAWGETPGEGMDSGSGGGMSGMVSEEGMTALQDAEGPEAAQLYLEQMIAHHEGAVEMAQPQTKAAQNPQAHEMAHNIVDTQTTEIETMEGLLQGL